MRVDDGRKGCWSLLAIQTKARTVVGRGEKGLLSDPGSELRLKEEARRKEKCEDNTYIPGRGDEQKNKRNQEHGRMYTKKAYSARIIYRRVTQVHISTYSSGTAVTDNLSGIRHSFAEYYCRLQVAGCRRHLSRRRYEC